MSVAAYLFLILQHHPPQDWSERGEKAPRPGIELSLDALVALGTSTLDDEGIQALQGGGHDPRERGFTLQNIELSARAALDPDLWAEARLVYFIDAVEDESVVELEELFAVATGLPGGLELEAGLFLTEVGRMNAQHPHQWDFQDQPVIFSRLFGEDGLRGAGLRLKTMIPGPLSSTIHAGVQDARGETMTSFLADEELFEERAIGGRSFVDRSIESPADLLYLLRWEGTGTLREDVTVSGGLSTLAGPNATGSKGRTWILATDLRIAWKPEWARQGWPSVTLQAEAMARHFSADRQAFDPDGLPATGDEFSAGRDPLRDAGFYAYLLWGFARPWTVGARVEAALSRGATLDPLTGADISATDPFRDRRRRWSAIVTWQPSGESRVRLQYNLDEAGHLDAIDEEPAHSIWLGFEYFFGGHPAHDHP